LILRLAAGISPLEKRIEVVLFDVGRSQWLFFDLRHLLLGKLYFIFFRELDRLRQLLWSWFGLFLLA
jgi:hypothetical protein